VNAFAGGPDVFKQFLAGWISGAKELAIFLAPTVNSYKRYAAGSWAPTTLAWGHDNRTCGFRIVGHGAAQRIETRIPGGDVNPYLAFAALIAAGIHGIEGGSNRRRRWRERIRVGCGEVSVDVAEAIEALERGTIARAALGDDVVDHYLNYARTEQRLFDEVVTCYERERLFERG
jgi:glutamine synthetase